MTQHAPRSAVDIVTAVRAGTLTCEQVVDDAVEASQQALARTNCFVEIDVDGARVAARALDRSASTAAMNMPGVPYGFKDIFTRRGQQPSLGVTNSRVRTRARDSTCLNRLDDAGAVAIGRLNLDPYGYSATGLNPQLGHVRNPWNTDHIAGGSSSGAAAAVAAGALPIAIGSDTAGSVRIPAALCGVVGFKPTYGRVPRTGSAPLSYSQDTIGIVARTVNDVALALSVIGGYDPADPSSFDARVPDPIIAGTRRSAAPRAPLHDTRIGVDEQYLADLCSPEIADSVTRSCAALSDLGAQIVAISLDQLPRYDIAASVLTWCEAGAVHQNLLAHDHAGYPVSVRERLYQALTAHGTDHVNALRVQGAALKHFLGTVLQHCDVIATCAAPVHAPLLTDAADDPTLTTVRLLNTNRPFNFLGLPAITVPMGLGSNNLPLGLQLAARPWAEHRLLHVAAAFQHYTAHSRLSERPNLSHEGTALS